MRTVHKFLACLVLATAFVSAPIGFGNEVTNWNKITLDNLSQAHMDLLESERALAIVQIAVYEAANAVQPLYVRSSIAVPDSPGASLPAAVAEAVYRTMVALAPARTATIEAERTRRLAALPESPQKTAGIATGAAAAAAVLHWRSDDGADWSTSYTPGSGPGVYQMTSDRPMAGPVAAKMQPFVLTTYADFLPPPPPPLDSPQMRRDLEEVAAWGGSISTLRTADQTESAKFHSRPGVFAWSSIGRQAAAQHHLGEVETSHLLAALETTVIDVHLSLFEAKYAYNLWRPVTALRAGGGPLNLKLLPDWTPLIPVPMIPEYPCAHCGLGAAVSTVLDGLAGDAPVELSVEEGTVTRHYHSFRQYAEEESLARIYGGVHYRWSNYVGESMGRQVGSVVLAKVAQSLSTTGGAK